MLKETILVIIGVLKNPVKDPWLQPYSDQEIVRLARSGVKRLLVMCPAFVADCLETIEEMGLRGCELFLEAGGTEFKLIPCLNEHPHWIAALEKMADRFLGNTPKAQPGEKVDRLPDRGLVVS